MNTDPARAVCDSGLDSGLDDELVNARDATVVVPLTQLGLIEFSGDDARTYLHRQLSSNVERLAADRAQYSAWCSPQGRMLASFVLFRRDADYLALLASDLAEAIEKRLRIYVLRSKVTIARPADREIIGLSGPRAAAALQDAGLQAPAAAMSTTRFGGASVIRLDETRHLVVADRGAAPGIWRSLSAGAVPASVAAWQWLDVAAGIPWIVEATREAFVPQMVNFDRIGGVSFDKGCYPGQEVVARVRHLGKVRRRLYRVRADCPIRPGMPVFSATPKQACGQIAGAARAPGGGYDALAVILEDAAGQGGLRVPADGGDIALTDILCCD
jgi:folate-binding protein YgfZ